MAGKIGFAFPSIHVCPRIGQIGEFPADPLGRSGQRLHLLLDFERVIRNSTPPCGV